jgi:hypothetical protein
MPPLAEYFGDPAVDQKGRYSIALSMANSIVTGSVSPSAFTVARLTANSNFVGCWIGRSPGFSPLSGLQETGPEFGRCGRPVQKSDLRNPGLRVHRHRSSRRRAEKRGEIASSHCAPVRGQDTEALHYHIAPWWGVT